MANHIKQGATFPSLNARCITNQSTPTTDIQHKTSEGATMNGMTAPHSHKVAAITIDATGAHPLTGCRWSRHSVNSTV
jgi:hypothetical protein